MCGHVHALMWEPARLKMQERCDNSVQDAVYHDYTCASPPVSSNHQLTKSGLAMGTRTSADRAVYLSTPCLQMLTL